MTSGNDRYCKIINLPHHTSTVRHHMSNYDRAAQFSPFAALTGYDVAISETARLTDSRIELDECVKDALNQCLRFIQDNINEHPVVSVLYFLMDKKKEGGSYRKYTGKTKKIDEFEKIILFEDGTKINIDDIYSLSGDFPEYMGESVEE